MKITSFLRRGFTYLRCTYQHCCLVMYNTCNLSHCEAMSSSVKSHYVTFHWLFILLDKTSLVLLVYVLVHHPNCLTSHCESITKATKACGLAIQLAKYVLCARFHAIANDISSWILTFSST